MLKKGGVEMFYDSKIKEDIILNPIGVGAICTACNATCRVSCAIGCIGACSGTCEGHCSGRCGVSCIGKAGPIPYSMY